MHQVVSSGFKAGEKENRNGGGSDHVPEDDSEMHREDAGVGQKHHHPQIRSAFEIGLHILVKGKPVSEEESEDGEKEPGPASSTARGKADDKDEVDEMKESIVHREKQGGAPFSRRGFRDALAIAGEPLGAEGSEQEDAEKMEEPDDDALCPVEDHQGPEAPAIDHRQHDRDDIAHEDTDAGVILRGGGN